MKTPKEEAKELLAEYKAEGQRSLRFNPPDCPECKAGRLICPPVRYEVTNLQPERVCSNCDRPFWYLLYPTNDGKWYVTGNPLEPLAPEAWWYELKKKGGGSDEVAERGRRNS
jgi:hypothetical protein